MNSGNIATGGPLNHLNEEMKCNAVYKTVSVMRLVASHKPKSSDELHDLIDWHVNNTCGLCGLRSNGTVAQFGDSLYNAQFDSVDFLDKYHIFSKQECYSFMFNLFCVAPLRGIFMEEKSKESILKELGSGYTARDASDEEDRKYAVDYVIELLIDNHPPKDLIGIQVKPQSFWKQEEPVKINNQKHDSYKKCYNIEAVYHAYNNKSLTFQNTYGLAKKISALAI